jgi:hypothetical protein
VRILRSNGFDVEAIHATGGTLSALLGVRVGMIWAKKAELRCIRPERPMFKNARRMIQNDGMFFKERRRIAELALTRKIPSSVFTSIMVDDGGLVAYGHVSPLSRVHRQDFQWRQTRPASG